MPITRSMSSSTSTRLLLPGVVLATMLALVAIFFATPAGAEDWTADSYGPRPFTFPVVGQDGVDFHYSDTFGAPRSGGRSHHGVDIGTYRVKGVPVVAAGDGVIKQVNWSSDPGDLNPERCCTLSITHDDGYETRYLHLNNDTQRADGTYTDDGQGWGIADGILPGVRVVEGQLIGWVGDSGNAEWVTPHLHWEVHAPGGIVVNPTPYADWAIRIPAPGEDAIPEPEPEPDPAPEPEPDAESAYSGAFLDDEGNVHEANIDIIAGLGITKGCNPPANDEYCPLREITRGEMAAFIRRLLELPASNDDFFGDDDESIFSGDINAITEAGIGFGCTDTDYCPDRPLLREEMAELLVRTFGYDNPQDVDLFGDDGSSVFESSINALGNHGITKGCNPPDN
ncbi:MAG: M23 family metallopeptidase, partial [Actinomycetota bacterium]|nr:M23 family metallopeptidase [Actinomycetota bacterium]